jgi:mannose-6-phosphate isomerase-like protein (cupin superfamily)
MLDVESERSLPMQTGRAQFVWGALAGASAVVMIVSGFALLSGDVSAAAQASPGTTKYASKVVLENARVRVKDVTFPAGAISTGMHTHELPHVGIILTPGSLVFSEPGKQKETVKFDVGSVGYRDANVTHDAGNPGQTPMRVIEVELK